jgi:hypothetical protein
MPISSQWVLQDYIATPIYNQCMLYYPAQAPFGAFGVPLHLTKLDSRNINPTTTQWNAGPLISETSNTAYGGGAIGYGTNQLPKLYIEGWIDSPYTYTPPTTFTNTAPTLPSNGHWIGSVGTGGYQIFSTAGDYLNLPTGVTESEANVTGRHNWITEAESANNNLLQVPGNPTQGIGACIYSNAASETVTYQFASAWTGYVSVYAYSDTGYGRIQTIQVGAYAPTSVNLTVPQSSAWVQSPVTVAAGGSVSITVVETGTGNPVIAGVFFDTGTPVFQTGLYITALAPPQWLTYPQIMAAYFSGTIGVPNSYNNRWATVDPTAYRDPYGRVYNSPRVLTFTAARTEAVPYRHTFTMTLLIGQNQNN